MAINPIAFARTVNEQFLRYQLTAFPITDEKLARQAEDSIRGAGARPTPLIKGPYLSLAKAFQMGPTVPELVDQGILHPALIGIVEHPELFAHQWETLQRIREGRHCLVSTGTGSGKTEAFLIPILDHCLRLRDQEAADGLVAVVVYPMNALAVDQLGRLRRMLAGTNISFGMYVGSTAADEGELENVVRMKAGEGKPEYAQYVRRHRAHERVVISPPEERLTEKEMVMRPPRILLTNYNQLEILLTRGKDLGMFVDAPLRFLVFDETHTYTGAVGAEVACLLRRLRAFCGKRADEVICIGTSATITDPVGGEEAVRSFAHRFFGVDPDRLALVREEYLEEEWPAARFVPPAPTGDGEALLERTLAALGDGGNPAEIETVVRELMGREIRLDEDWSATLHGFLKQSECVKTLAEVLERPRHLDEVVGEMASRVGRAVADAVMARAEILATLALGAAAERGENPLLRPKAHYFVQGLEGAVATFVEEAGGVEPRLYLSIERALADHPERMGTAFFPVLSCKTCGQHYFTAWLKDFSIEAGEVVGGEAEGDQVIWKCVPEEDGDRVVFTDRFLAEESEDPGEAEAAAKKLEARRIVLFLCRHCGAVHRADAPGCGQPTCRRAEALVPVSIVLTKSVEGRVLHCPSCMQRGRQIGDRIIEPLKPLRAITVADVHILGQDMLNAVSEAEQKLLVFTDNRQDAAFQAGWMQDHARRYRMRHLIHDFIREQSRPTALGDVQAHLLGLFKADRDLAHALCPEVFSGRVEEAFGRGLEEALQTYLRIQLMREWATSFKQRDSLETWGVARMLYAGITAEDPRIQEWATRYNMAAEEVAEGIAALLDVWRRGRYLYDPQAPIFSRYWHESAEEVQRGYLPFMDFPPKGLKFERAPADRETWVTQLVARKGQTLAQGFLAKWGLRSTQYNTFLEELWHHLTETWKVLVPVTLLGQKGNPLPGCAGLFQVGTQATGLAAQFQRYRCGICHRVHSRMPPKGVCTTHHCGGIVRREEPPETDYNVATLRRPFSMVRAQEHSAQVPARVREGIERDFKAVPGKVNCLVATPTLELGVDIGALDMVLLRNVPPRPSNYWQRVGRAGRRHRMAVLYTYCRRSQHDAYFFEDPKRLLDGRIETPRFNLRNPVMIRKHVHAAVLSELIRITRLGPGASVTEGDIQEVRETLAEVLPTYVSGYLFEADRRFRVEPFDVSRLGRVVARHRHRLVSAVVEVFATHWPQDGAAEVAPAVLEGYVDEMVEILQKTVTLLYRRMMWAVERRRTLSTEKGRRMLEEYEERILRRCDEYLKGLTKRDRINYTLTVLAVEGFLPGYGTYEGGVRGFAGRSLAAGAKAFEFDLSRPPSMALREFVPGNLIYANSGRFKVTLFHLPIGQSEMQPETYVVNVQKESLREKGTGRAGYSDDFEQELIGIPICDVDLAYTSRISDEEQNRFQMPVQILGYRKAGHRGGEGYRVGGLDLLHLRGQDVRLVNVGPADRVRRGLIGYPVCRVCGATRSPYASDAEIQHFADIHRERCGREPGWLAFSADTQVDGLLVQSLGTKGDAVNLGEALRQGASRILEMDPDDLNILTFPTEGERWDLFIYDPMPGGSGLLSQILERWKEVRDAALDTVTQCKGQCERSCYECLRAYRNVFYHGMLDRHAAKRLLDELPEVNWEREIPAQVAADAVGVGLSTNPPEVTLGAMIERAGFPTPTRQHEIRIGQPVPKTAPDFAYVEEPREIHVAIYLDGLSKGIHGGADVSRMDRMIRQQLEADGWTVIEIATSDLNDPQAMVLHFKKLAIALRQRERGHQLADDRSWFSEPVPAAAKRLFELIAREVARPFVTHLPVYSLRAAAGKFGEAQDVQEEGWVDVAGRRLRESMFVAQIVGTSMEPRIPDGSYCLFRAPVEGSRQGKILLVQHREIHDPEGGGSFTVKRYSSEKVTNPDGTWRHSKVTLSPLNPDYQPIVLTPEAEDEVQVIAEWLAVL